MMFNIHNFFLFHILLQIIGAESEVGSVLHLTGDNVQSEITNADMIFIEYYAPWCGHCKKITPEFARAATRLKKDNISVCEIYYTRVITYYY